MMAYGWGSGHHGLCRYFQQYRPREDYGVCGLVLAEEKGACWSTAGYIRVHGELGAHRFNMNVDLAGQLIEEMFWE